MLYKIKDLLPGEAMFTTPFSDNKSLVLEDAVFQMIAKDLPKEAALVRIDVSVKIDIARKPGDKVPIDVQMFQWNMEINDFTKPPSKES